MTPEEIQEGVAKRAWYHKIELDHGISTVGAGPAFESVWNLVRDVRRGLNYEDASVLDIGTWDGMWAFEAEDLGARHVVATDIWTPAMDNFEFCKAARKSKAVAYFNVSPYNLTERLDSWFQVSQERETFRDYGNYQHRLFDIAQHLGVFYHLRDPIFSLAQTRSVLKTGGYVLLETAAVLDEKNSYLLFNGVPPGPLRVYDTYSSSTYFAPTIMCLTEMLRLVLLEVVPGSVQTLMHFPDKNVGRVALIARAVGPETLREDYLLELVKTSRNPGFRPDHLESWHRL